MSATAIHVDNLGKQYRLGVRQDHYSTIRESMTNAMMRPIRRIMGGGSLNSGAEKGTLWALKDVSFEVKQGDVVGIIGRNGSGKTTLLKILSRITEPTTGMARIYGRVGSLLEVGTGFHPELTGRENIFLNGAILGMRRGEIAQKFDEIVSFSEIERFLDTPVKRYSSGMYVRLAFAVAAHLDPEVFMVDEVLAVGDVEFQKKCLGRMGDVNREGRTVLFVSHNMASITQLCQWGLLLDEGKIVQRGEISEVIQTYLSLGHNNQAEIEFSDQPHKAVQVKKLQVLNDQGVPSSELDRTKPFQMAIEVVAHENVRGTVNLALSTGLGVRVCHSICADYTKQYTQFEEGQRLRFLVEFPGNLLNEGDYQYKVWLVPGNSGGYDLADSPVFFIRSLSGTDSFVGERKKRPDIFRIPLQWQVMKG